MRKNLKKVFGVAMSAMMVATTMAFTPVNALAASAISFTKTGGWYESAFAEWSSYSGASSYNVYYKTASASSYTKADSGLVRGTRVDIPGLKANTTYTIKVVPVVSGSEQDGAASIFTATTAAFDRSGYAHFNYSNGVGAYNNDGTLKSNAIVITVTDANKNSVTVPGYANSPKGIGNILNFGSPTNNDILNTLAKDGHPLVVRFAGTVNAPEGLTGYASTTNGGSVSDNGYMAIMKHSKNVTLEGLGTDAKINGWGFSFFVGVGYTNKESYEVRNLTFANYPEDAVGFQGEQTGSGDSAVLTDPIERAWVHNNTFYPGYCAKPIESDKAEGDGSCDFKRGQYYTMAYNKYIDCHKTNLVGGGDSMLQFHATLHHNYYENCGSRSPLARRSNIHIYNTYFKGNTSKTVDARAKSYIFSENNYFEDCKNPVTIKSAAVKSFNDVFSGCSNTNAATIVSSRTASVSSDCKYAGFDTNASIFYYDASNKKSNVSYLTSAEKAKSDCINYSGVMNASGSTIGGGNSSTVVTTQTTKATTTTTKKTTTTEKTTEATTKATTTTTKKTTTTEKTTEATTSSAKTWNFGSSAFNGLGTLTASKTVNGLSILATSSKTVEVKSNPLTFNGSTYSHCLALGGSGSTTYRAVKFAVNNGDKINVVLKSSGSSARTLNVVSSSGKVLGTITAGSSIGSGSYTYTGSGESVYLYSANSGINVYEVKVGGSTAVVTTKATTTTEKTTEATTKATTTTTKATTTTTKKTTTTTTSSSKAVANGTYKLNSSTLSGKACTYKNMQFNLRSVESSAVKLRSANTITFTLAAKTKVTLDPSGKGLKISGSSSKTLGTGTVSATLNAGTYTISGAASGSNTTISYIKFENA